MPWKDVSEKLQKRSKKNQATVSTMTMAMYIEIS